MPSQNELKSVDDYNAEQFAKRRERERAARMTGVACPKCGGELEWEDTTLYRLLHPPRSTRTARCPKDKLTVELQLP